MNKTVSFHLAINATPQDVGEVIDAIHRLYNIDTTTGVSPASVAASQAPAAAASTIVNTAAAGTDGQRDKDGFLWDERIHSSSKALTEKGVWRTKKNLAAGLKEKVEAELRAAMGVTAPAAAAATTAALPPMPGAATTAALPPMPGVNPALTQFTLLITDLIAKGTINDDWVKAVLTNYGVPNGDIQNLAQNPTLLATVEAAIKQACGIA